MSKKRRIIIFSVIAILAVCLILFSTVFRVRKQNVVFSEQIDGVSAEMVIHAGEIKNGKSVFLINKEEIKGKIEKAIPYAKVEKIFLTFPNTINVEISKRVEFCYFERGEQFLICDASLKILRTSIDRPELIKIDTEMSSSVDVGDFIAHVELAEMFDCFGEMISIEIDGENSPEFTLNAETAITRIDCISFDKTSGLFLIKSKEGFSVEYNIEGDVREKHYYLMGIIVDNNSSILRDDERISGKVFVLKKTSNGMHKYSK